MVKPILIAMTICAAFSASADTETINGVMRLVVRPKSHLGTDPEKWGTDPEKCHTVMKI